MDGCKFVSQDNYDTWFFGGAGRGKGLDDWSGMHDIAFTATAGTWYAVQGQGNQCAIYKTTNAGTSWTKTSLPPGVSNEPTGIYANPASPAQVWVAWSGKLFYSPSSGSSGSWTQLAVDASYGSISALTGDATNANPLTIWIGTSTGLFLTTDGTNFLQQGASGTAKGITRIRLDSTNPNRIWIVNANYYSTNSWDTGLWRFTTTTNTWSNLASWGNPSSPVKDIVDVDVDPTNTNRIAVATNVEPYGSGTGESGVWVNENSGASNAWTQQNAGLPLLRIHTIAFRPGTSQLVAGCNGRGFYVANTDGSILDLSPSTNLLLTNANFEALTYGTGHVTGYTGIPGWIFNLDSYSWGGVQSGAATGKEGALWGFIQGGGSFETAAGSRAPVVAGISYIASMLIDKNLDNIAYSTPCTISINWYNGNVATSTIVSTSTSAPLLSGAATNAFQPFSLTATAPAGATYAAVKFYFSRGVYPNQDTANFGIDDVQLDRN